MTNLPDKIDPETREAMSLLKQCPKCQGRPAIKYEPGCSYSFCIVMENDCPCRNAVPDFDPIGLVEKINEKNTIKTNL